MLRLTRGIAIVVVLLPALSPSTYSQQTDSSSARSDSAYHLNAGTSSLQQVRGERVLVLRNGVTIVHGDVTITSDEGRQYTARRLTRLIGNVTIDQQGLHMEGDEGEYLRFEDRARLLKNVHIVDRGFDIRCDEAIFYRTDDQAWLIGNVLAADSTTTLTADSVFYDRGAETVEVFGDVTIANADEGVQVKGAHGFLYRDRNEAVMDSLPRLIVDPETREPTTVVSDIMRFYPDDSRAIADGRVKIIKGNTITQCDSAVVFDDEQRAELYGGPLAKRENMSMQADLMRLYYTDEEVNRIGLVGNAVMLETVQDTLVRGRDSWIKGDSLDLYVHANRLDSIRVNGNAVSQYYPRSPQRVESNYAEGERMFFVFENDSLSFVGITGDVEGTYQYMTLAPRETADSLRAAADTSLTYRPFPEKAEAVEFFADTVGYFAKRRDLILDNNARVDYQKRTLLGKHITYNADLELLDASGAPVLIEGPDKFYGDQMDYDLETEVGLVRRGSTQFMQGYYQGQDIAKVGDNVLKVWNSTYTTCDLKVPHYHFTANQMKVYLDDKVVMAPIVLHIGETPVLALPFFAQNIRRGRRSGILRPDFEFGITSTGDRFLRDIGYFWATNDYTDFTLRGNFNEDRDISVIINNRYNKRYSFNGRIDYTYVKGLRDFGDQWTFSSDHGQVFGDNYQFAANLNFVSSEQAPKTVNNLDDVQDVINRNIRSTVSLRKSWGNAGFSASATREQNLNITDPGATKVRMTLPDLRLSIPSSTLYFGKRTTRGEKGLWEEFLDGIRFSPGLDFNYTELERLFDKRRTIRSNQSLSFSSPRKIGFINVSPALSASNSYERNWFDVKQHLDADSMLVTASSSDITDNRFSWNTGVSASTRFYGTFYPGLGRLSGLRHTVAPSVRYSLTPAQQGRPRFQSFGLSLRNALDVKLTTASGEDRKISNVVNWSLSSAYNPDAPSGNQWAPISSNFNTQLLRVDLSLSNSVDPYQWDVLSTQVRAGFGYTGVHALGLVPVRQRELNIIAADTTNTVSSPQEIPGATDDGQLREGLPWSISGNISFNKTQLGEPRSTFNVNGSFNVTRNWRVQYDTSYDVQERALLGYSFSVYRDLHCWEMSFHRRQLANDWEFYFKINLKAFPEIYADQGNRRLGGTTTFGIPFQ